MAGRGRGRGNLSRWSPTFDGRVIASVPPLKKTASQSGSKVERLKNMLSCVRVTCIIDVNHFWAQLGSATDLEHFDNYMFALNHWCDNQLPSSLNDMPAVGQVVCVRHAATRMWRRAEVTRLSQRSVDVFFLDYGEAECVSLDMLCSNVPSDITSWPPQALYCTLDGIQPPEGEDQWSEKAVKRFSELVSFGQNLAASHENESLQLTLYLVDEGGLKSVGSILVEEGLAQELNHKSRSETVWPQEPTRKSPQNKDSQQLKNLDKLEQQLVMSGFSYLLNPCNTMDPKPAPVGDYSYESTTISSSYCTYKRNKDSPVVTSSGQVHNFAPIKERSPQNHLSNRPHLASPGEFMTSHKTPPYAPGLVQEESQARQRPNPGNNGNNGHHPHHNPWYNAWSQNDWKLPQNKNTQLFTSNDIFAGDKNHQPLPDVSFQDAKKATSSLQYHLNGPSAFHDPKYKQQQPLMGPFEVHGGVVLGAPANTPPREVKEPIAKPQSSPVVSQSSMAASNKEKTLKTELSWQKWKFQRNVKRLFDKTDCDGDDIGMEIGELINAGKLSQNFEGVSEVMIVLEMITERVMDRDGFGPLAAKICSSLSGQEIHQFTRYMCEVVTAIRDDLVEQFNVSDWEERCERFCSFIGEMVLIAAEQDSSDSGFKPVVEILTRESLETWLTLDQMESEEKQSGYVICLTGLLTVIGPVIEEQNIRFGGFDLGSIFSVIRDHVLSDSLPRSIKNSLLDLLLLKTAGWVDKTKDTDSTNDDEDDEVDVNDEEEDEEDEDDGSEEKDDSEQEWDPYDKIHNMLEKLKLEDLFKRFKDNCIRDTLLVANKDEFKKTLQEAGFPPGVILEIQMFLEKGDDVTERKKTIKNKPAQQPSRNTNTRRPSNNDQHSPENNVEKQENPVPQDIKWIPQHKTRDIQLARQALRDNNLNRERNENERQQEEERRSLAEQARMQDEERRMAEQQTNLHQEGRMFERRENVQTEQESTERRDSRGFLSYEPVHQAFNVNARRIPEPQHQQSLQNIRLPTHQDIRVPVNNPELLESPQDEIVLSSNEDEEQQQLQDANDELTPAVDEQKRPTHEQEENRTIIDAHNLFEPSYLSRPPPLRVEPVTYEYEQEQESPGNDGPMSYSEVLKAKNEDPFPDPPSKPMPVKLTSLTKANAGENTNTQNKQTIGKSTSKDTTKDGKRDQVPRPPPGLPPLPPQNWGQTAELRLTVLPNARRKPEDSTPPEDIWHSKQGFDSPPRPSIGRGSASRGRHEPSTGRGVNRGNTEWPSTSEPTTWRRLDLGGRGSEQHVARPFGPGGQKACFTCGSREHMSCNDRSKLFFD